MINMKDHFGYLINKNDYILHITRFGSSIDLNAGKVLDIDENKQMLVCKMCDRTKLSYISNMYCTIVMDKDELVRKYPGVYDL